MIIKLKKSTPAASVATLDNEIRNTGLRPSWADFWQVDEEYGALGDTVHAESDIDNKSYTVSTMSTIRSEDNGGFKHKRFITGSEWYGEWDGLGMSGMGTYKMAHGVVYEGTMNAGVFEGIGTLRYPNGGILEGFWHEGKLKYCQYEYSDGLKRETHLNWPYCTPPDRRFYTEALHGLKPATHEQVTNAPLAREIPAGQYDVGDGFYSPVTKCVTDPITGEVLRIPTAVEEKWILEFSRAASLNNVGFRPDLYENLFRARDTEEEDNKSADCSDKQQILDLILQDGELESKQSSVEYSRRSSWQFKLENCTLAELMRMSSVFSQSTVLDFETVMKRAIKEKTQKHFRFIRSSSDDYEDEREDSIIHLLHDLAMSFSKHRPFDIGKPKPSSVMEQCSSDHGLNKGFTSASNNSPALSMFLHQPYTSQSMNQRPETPEDQRRSKEASQRTASDWKRDVDVDKISPQGRSEVKLDINYDDYDSFCPN